MDAPAERLDGTLGAVADTEDRYGQGLFDGCAGEKLFDRWWRPEGTAKAAVVVVHGFAEHSGRYERLANALTQRGLSVHAHDQRGHGQSTGLRAHVESFDQLIDDLATFVARVREREGSRPLFLFGHSLGGLVVISYLLARRPDVRGVALSGAMLKVGADISPTTVRVARLLGRWLPKVRLQRADPKLVSRHAEMVAAYMDDPLIYHGGIRARLAAESLGAVDSVRSRMTEIDQPLLVLHGGGDRLVDPQGSRDLYESSRSTDKRLEVYDGLFHEILNEPEGAGIADTAAEWVTARTGT